MPTPTQQQQTIVDNAIKKIGTQAAADHFGISYESVKSVGAGYNVRNGTLAILAMTIDKALPAPKARKVSAKKKPKISRALAATRANVTALKPEKKKKAAKK